MTTEIVLTERFIQNAKAYEKKYVFFLIAFEKEIGHPLPADSFYSRLVRDILADYDEPVKEKTL